MPSDSPKYVACGRIWFMGDNIADDELIIILSSYIEWLYILGIVIKGLEMLYMCL
jgi:hypothetical protein